MPPFAAERHVAGVTTGISRSDYIETKSLEALPNQGGQVEDMIVHLFTAQCLEVAESVDKGVKTDPGLISNRDPAGVVPGGDPGRIRNGRMLLNGGLPDEQGVEVCLKPSVSVEDAQAVNAQEPLIGAANCEVDVSQIERNDAQGVGDVGENRSPVPMGDLCKGMKVMAQSCL